MADDLEIEQDDDQLRQQRIADAASRNPDIMPQNIPGPSAGDKTPPVTLRGITPPDPAKERLATDQAELTRQEKTGSGISQVKNPIGRGVLRGLNVVGSMAGALNPMLRGIVTAIPGTEEHHNSLMNRQAGRIGEDLGEQEKQATTAGTIASTAKTEADTGAVPGQIAERAATTAKTNADVQAMGQPKPKEEEWSIVPGAQGPKGEPIQQEKNSGQIRFANLPGATVRQPNEKPDNLDQQYAEAASNGDHVTMQRILKVKEDLAKAGQPPQRDPRQLAVGPDGKVIELTPGMTVPQGSKTMAGELTNKPSPDEQRRADLAENMNENMGQLEEILNRRPDLFGPAAGRWASLKGAVGTDDPDIAALKVIKEQMGMAMVGAHAMRNAQHVETAANALVNSFNNEPQAIKGALAAARKSLSTFQNDVDRPANRGAMGAPAGQAKEYGPAPAGKPEGATGTLPDGTKVVVKGGRLVAQ